MHTRWQELGSHFQQIYDLPVGERQAYLDEIGLQDGSLRQEVESLLRAHDLAEHFTRAGSTVSVGELSPASQELMTGRQLGPYTVLEELGHGGMSTVFLAARADDEFDRLVAIKTLRGIVGPDGYGRFLAERQMHANLEHPGIARLYGGGTTQRGVPYIVMEYIDGGQPVDAYCGHHQLPAAARIELFAKICGAVAHAHRNLVVHRDLKPANILVTRDGEPKLLDFGISKLLTPESSDWDPTGSGPGPLTPRYASPEQILGERITTASDVFSLGVLLYRLLAGRSPYPSRVSERLRELRDEKTTPSLEQIARSTAGSPASREFLALERGRRQDLTAIAAKALRREAGERYGSVEQFVDDLRCWQQDLPVSSRLPTFHYRFSRWLRRNRLIAGFVAVFVTTLLASSVLLLAQKADLARERDRAREAAATSDQFLSLLFDLLEGSDPASTRGADISVRDLLRGAEERIDHQLIGQPRARAALLEALGRVFFRLGELDEAERTLARVREFWRTQPESSEGAATLDYLARIQIQRGDFAKALELLERGRQLRQVDFGPNSSEEAKSLAGISYVQLLFGQNAKAKATARRAVEIFRQLGDDKFVEERLYAQFNLGEALSRQRGYEAAVPIFEEMLEDARESLGDDHPSTLAVLGKLADLLSQHPLGLDLAAQYAREKLAAQRRIYDAKDHHEIALSLDVLASILGKKGDLIEAEKTFAESIAMWRRLTDGESPFLAVTLGNFGWFHLFRRHDPQFAEPVLTEALEMAEKFYSPDRTLLTYPLIGIGRCRTLVGEPIQGEPYLRRAVAIREAAYGAGSLMVARAELFLGENLVAQGRCREAEPLLDRSKAAIEREGEPDDQVRFREPWAALQRACSNPIPASSGEDDDGR